MYLFSVRICKIYNENTHGSRRLTILTTNTTLIVRIVGGAGVGQHISKKRFCSKLYMVWLNACPRMYSNYFLSQ